MSDIDPAEDGGGPQLILPDDTPVDPQKELRNAHIQEVLDQLDHDLVGLVPVKTRIRETAALLLAEQNYRFNPETESVFREYLARRMTMPHFANARSVHNALDRARLRQANRLLASKRALTRLDLMTIEPEDILVSRVFSEGALDADTHGKDQPARSRESPENLYFQTR